MLKKIPVFALAFISGSTLAGPLANAVGGLLGTSGAGTAPTGITGLATVPMTSLTAITGPVAGVTSSVPLPGLGGDTQPEDGLLTGTSPLPIEITVLDDGPANNGYDTVVGLANGAVVSAGDGTGDEPGALDVYQDVLYAINEGEPLLTPYLLGDSQNPNIDVGIFDGDGTANADPDMGLGVAIGSGSNTGNGTIGIATLSDNRDGSSGNGTVLGISLLNRGDPLTISFMGEDTVSSSGTGGSIEGDDTQGLLSVSINGDDNTGNGGLIGLSILSGDNTGSGDIAVSLLSGDNSATAGLVGVAILSGDNSANGVTPSDGVPDDAPFLAVNVLSGSGSASDSGTGIGLTGDGEGNVTVLGKAGGSSDNGGGGGGGGDGGTTGPAGGNPETNGTQTASANDNLCNLLVKDAKGKVTQRIKARCSSLRTPKA